MPICGKIFEALQADGDFLASLHDEYGDPAQISMFIEEAAELIVALEKHRRAGSIEPERMGQALSNVAEETADVFIMLSQLVEIFGNDDDVAEWIKKKLERQRGRMGLLT